MEQNRKNANEIVASIGNYESSVSTSLDSLSNQNFIERLWAKDSTLWKHEPEHKKLINNSLGWLTVIKTVQEQINSVISFSDEIRASGFKQIVLLGMGGSSLAPEVLRSTFGSIPGYPELIVLDSTDPDAVTNIENRITISQTLFLFCSKSGSTIEPLSLFRYFYSRVQSIQK